MGTPSAMAAAQAEPHTMRCFEVWGGNNAVDHGVVMAGLDAWLYSRPYAGHKAGGDIHYVSSCAAGLVTRLLIADVSGHGDAVAETATGLRSLMHRFVNYIDQTQFVSGLNEAFGAFANAGGFATAVVATYLAPANQLTLSNAGHPKPLWYRAKTRTWSFLGENHKSDIEGIANVPLGIAEPTQYDQFAVKLAKGDLIIFYTDSLIEAAGPDAGQLGQQGLLNLCASLEPSDPSDFLHALIDGVGASQSSASASDDVTILIIRPNAFAPRPSRTHMFFAELRMAAAIVTSLLPGAAPARWPDTGPLASLRAGLHRINPRWGN
jgi:phosphoserine phosphatase RsbU/P